MDKHNRRFELGLVITVLMVMLCASKMEKKLTGSWRKASPLYYAEEIVFDREGEFRSYLHHRPFAFGKWLLAKDTLEIETPFPALYRIEIKDDTLWLISDRREVYLRIE